MPGAPEHPVTLGDLFVHYPTGEEALLPGGGYHTRQRPATVADLVSALRAEGVLVIGRVPLTTENYGPWPKWAVEVLRYEVAALAEAPAVEILDALAEAQPFPPEGR